MKTRANKAVAQAAFGALALNAAFPALAFASEEESGGLSAILPDMAEFIPMLIAFIVAPQLEFSFRQAMMLSRGQATVFFTHPISLGFLLLAAASLVQVARMLRKRKALEAARSAPDEAEESA